MPVIPLDSPRDSAESALARLLTVPRAADLLGRRFDEQGHELHLVGGSVRDALLGRPDDDLDFATDAAPEQILECVGPIADALWTTGVAFGTVGVSWHGRRVEITTYRSESYDRTSRNPHVTYGETLEEDLGRRDFTINAMAVSVPGHVFCDPYGGLADLGRRMLRTSGRPERSFDEDPLRILRGARFVAQLALRPDPSVIEAMRSRADRLKIVAPERVREELVKLILAPDPVAGLALLVDTGAAEMFLPELPALRLEIDEHHQHKDVYAHSLRVLERAIDRESDYTDGPNLRLRLAALLHDIGKPRTRKHLPRGGVSFHHHEAVGRKMAIARLSALRFPRDVVEDVGRLVEMHLRFHGYGMAGWTDSAVRRYAADAGDLLPLLHALVRSDCTTRNRRKAAALEAAYDDLERRIADLADKEELARIRPDIDGNEVMRVLGVPPGPIVGRALAHLLDLRFERGPQGRDAAAAELLAWARDEGLAVAAKDTPQDT
ncbi:MAG: CCA tRNA nucleotidyltransferase [Frankiaceae bacterium]